MKALFVHDHIFYKKENEYYSPGGLPASAWSRYLDSFDSLYVVSRGIEGEIKGGLIKSSRECVFFDLFYEVRGGVDYYRFQEEIKKKLRSYIEKVDVVIIRVPSTIGYFAYQICKELGRPFVSEVVGCAWDSTWNYGSMLIKMQAPLRFFQMKSIVKNSFAVTYVTKFFLQKRYPTKSEITINASNVQLPKVTLDVKEKHIESLNRKMENFVLRLGIIGNLTVKYKGFDVAFKALQKLKEHMPEIKFQFLLVGGGDQKYVKSLIEKFGLLSECIIVGRLEAGNEVFQFLDSLDLYIHPSKQEGLPRSVIEAMSRATPVLASSVAGIPELIDNKFLHKPGDFNKLFNDLRDILSDSKLRVSMASSNFEKSKDYVQDILESRRKEFFSKIVEVIRKEKLI